MKEGTIATVLKQVGQPVSVDEVIAQVETDKVTIDVKAPQGGFITKVCVKASDVVTPGTVVAVVGASAGAAAGGPTPAGPGGPTGASAGLGHAATAASASGRTPSIHFPPRVTPAGVRISDLKGAEYDAAIAAAKAPPPPTAAPAAAPGAAPAAAPAAPAPPAPATGAAAPAMLKAAPPPNPKNRLPFITRPDGRGGPPRRPLNARELDLINLGGAY
ncbi:hypothetical protein HYH03_018619 [Edaphochlamys debaryana]|uniref:Lipoyl-binding domain-containing protein n=1 Tax=Edaphochlamys debaryana TaxID=47281 RepID=A0A835XLJ6_9CHLO|nr:hypothetical protein HYH03_018619 [Edaphochlamys debaryana]|eukprot:KAG2482449.1 hypothetical protein HYH03_018619 [Edaphochlamys debaryana]